MKIFLPSQPIFFKLLKQLCAHQKTMAMLLHEFARTPGRAEEFYERAKEIEHKADEKTHEIIETLNKSFVTPLDREDIVALTHELDDIVDLIESIINDFRLYRVAETRNALDRFAAVIVEASHAVESLIDHLQERRYSEELKKVVIRIHELEDAGDLIFEEAIRELFRDEKDAISVIKWKDILENLEEITDEYQKISDTVEGILVKAS